MSLLKQSTTYTRMFFLVLASDHVSPATGKTVTVTLSKAGGTFAAAGGTVTEVANGWYKIALTTTDTNTLGELAFHCTATACDDTDFADQVIAVDLADAVRLGLTALPNAAAAANGGLPTVDAANGVKVSAGTGTGQLDVSGGIVKSDLTKIGTSATSLTKLKASVDAIAVGTVVTGTLTTTEFTSDLTAFADEALYNRPCVWISGALIGTGFRIRRNLASAGRIYPTAMTGSPSNGDQFLVL